MPQSSEQEIYLFRLKLIRPDQESFLHDNIERWQLLNRVLLETPSQEMRNGNIWHIGNLEISVDGDGVFAFGKTANRKKESFDYEKREFVELSDVNSPSTKIYFNNKMGIYGIAKKSSVAPYPIDIAKRLAKYIQKSNIMIRNEIRVIISEIKDPTSFIQDLIEAKRIFKYSFSFTKPNPDDVDIELQKPLEKYAELVNADIGKNAVEGSNLSGAQLAKVTRGVAAMGNEAEAKLVKKDGTKAVKTRLKGNLSRIVVGDDKSTIDILKLIIAEYIKVRGD